MIKATIFKKNLNDNLKLEIILAMSYNKIFCLIKALKNNNSLFNISYQKNSNIIQLKIFDFTVYIFIHKNK